MSPPAAPDPPLPPPEALPSAVLPWCHARVLVCAFTAGTPQAAGLKDFPIITTKSLSWAVSRRPGPFLGARLSAAPRSSPPHICSSQTGFPPPPSPAQCFKSPVCPQISFPLVCEVSPRFQSHPHVLHTPARDRFRDSQHRPRAEAAGSPRAGDQAALPALAPHSPRATAPSAPRAWAEGAVLVAAPCLVKSPPNRALGARCWVLSASSSAPERNVLKLSPKACPLVHGMLLQPCKFISQVASLPPPQLAP